MDTTKLEAWGRLYADDRARGKIGWTTGESYALKQSRIREALGEHHVASPASFLELGCGAGNIALWMASRGCAACGIDVVPEAIDWARARARQADAAAEFHLGDISDMYMFAGGCLDIVFDGDCLQMIVDETRPQCFAEIFRILKPGGHLIAGGNVRDDRVNQRVGFGGGRCHFEPQTRSLFVEGEERYILLSERELCDELRSAGLRILDVRHHPKRGGHRFVKESIAVHATRESR